MGVNTIYTCDNPGCTASTYKPEGWLQSYEVLLNNPLVIYAFSETRAKTCRSFCGINCLTKFLSTQLPILQDLTKEFKKQEERKEI